MQQAKIPDRDRWYGWVALSWLLVVVAVLAGLALIATAGTVEVPQRDLIGNISWREEPNMMIWGIAIGQALASALFAALISIANSAYQNSCDLLRYVARGEKTGAPPPAAEVDSATPATPGTPATPAATGLPGIVIERIEPNSPLAGVMRPGFRIAKVNGRDVTTLEEADQNLRKGRNEFEFYNLDGRLVSRRLHVRTSRLHITASA